MGAAKKGSRKGPAWSHGLASAIQPPEQRGLAGKALILIPASPSAGCLLEQREAMQAAIPTNRARFAATSGTHHPAQT